MTSLTVPKPINVELEGLSVFVHGMLASLHLLGVVYNVRRRSYLDVAAHSAAFVYDIYAAGNHLRKSNEGYARVQNRGTSRT